MVLNTILRFLRTLYLVWLLGGNPHGSSEGSPYQTRGNGS
jgi:hypothetical protein